MVDPGARFRVSSSNIVHEEIDGETIAIDLSGGSYYSLAGGGSFVWSRLVVGASVDEVVAASAVEDRPEVHAQVLDLFERLATEGLIAPAPDATAADDGVAESAPARFEKPVLEKYDDLKDYFLIDPIHDVSAVGWPAKAGS